MIEANYVHNAIFKSNMYERFYNIQNNDTMGNGRTKFCTKITTIPIKFCLQKHKIQQNWNRIVCFCWEKQLDRVFVSFALFYDLCFYFIDVCLLFYIMPLLKGMKHAFTNRYQKKDKTQGH